MNNINDSIRECYDRERETYVRLKVLGGVLYPGWENDFPKLSVPDSLKVIEAEKFWADFLFIIRVRVILERPSDLTLILIDHIDEFIHGRFALAGGESFAKIVEIINTDLIFSWSLKHDEKREPRIDRPTVEPASAVGMPAINSTSIQTE